MLRQSIIVVCPARLGQKFYLHGVEVAVSHGFAPGKLGRRALPASISPFDELAVSVSRFVLCQSRFLHLCVVINVIISLGGLDAVEESLPFVKNLDPTGTVLRR